MSTFHAPTASPRASASSTIPAPSRRPLFGPVAGFSAFMSHADRTYQVDCEGTFAIGNERATVDLTMKVSGEDSEGTSVIAQDRERSVIQSIVKDGVQYVRLAGEGWKKQAQPPTGLPVDAFDRLAPDMLPLLEDHGLVRRDGSELHLLRVPNLDWASMSTSLLLDENGAGVVIREMSMSVWVTPAGEPRVAEIRIDATGRANGLEVDVTFDLSYRFTRVGEPVEIDAPARYEDAGQTSS